MSDAQLDSFPVRELQHRHKIVRSAVYTCGITIDRDVAAAIGMLNWARGVECSSLNIDGTSSTANPRISQGLRRFSVTVPIEARNRYLSCKRVACSSFTEQHSALAGLIEAIASRLMPMIASQFKPAPNLLASLRGLEEAYRNQGLLSTSDLLNCSSYPPRLCAVTVSSFLMQDLSSPGLKTKSGAKWLGESVRREEQFKNVGSPLSAVHSKNRQLSV